MASTITIEIEVLLSCLSGSHSALERLYRATSDHHDMRLVNESKIGTLEKMLSDSIELERKIQGELDAITLEFTHAPIPE
jgi:hypothetical protein